MTDVLALLIEERDRLNEAIAVQIAELLSRFPSSGSDCPEGAVYRAFGTCNGLTSPVPPAHLLSK